MTIDKNEPTFIVNNELLLAAGQWNKEQMKKRYEFMASGCYSIRQEATCNNRKALWNL